MEGRLGLLTVGVHHDEIVFEEEKFIGLVVNGFDVVDFALIEVDFC
jgi:hypothetical protein